VTSRREALAWLAAVLAGSGCGGSRGSPAESPPSEPSLLLDPIVDLVPAAALVWLVHARMRDLLMNPVLIPAVALLAPESRFDAFAQRHGGVDLRQTSDLAVASFRDDAMLGVARVVVDPRRVEAAFAARATNVEGRAVEHGVTRFWGQVGRQREQVAVFGTQAVGLESGRLGPLRAAEYFARGKLKRVKPALRVEPLAQAAAELGDAPLRAFAPGPFEGEWKAGLGGLLGAATSAAASLTPLSAPGNGSVAVRVVLTGAWGSDATAAAARLGAAFGLLAEDPLGHLTGIDRPLDGPRVAGKPDALVLDVGLDPTALARGLRDVTDAAIPEIMAV
jgi:hypothetical protein